VVVPASHALPRGAWYSSWGRCPRRGALRDSHPLWCGLPAASRVRRRGQCGACRRHPTGSQPRGRNACTLGTATVWAAPVSLATTPGLLSLPRGTKMFQFPRLPPRTTGAGSAGMNRQGLPHSETLGSQPDCGSPSVSLLVSVLHRLGVPRHPPPAQRVLPGQELLGGRGQRPRRSGRSSPMGPLRRIIDYTTTGLVRYRAQVRKSPCPLTCAFRAAPPAVPRGRCHVGPVPNQPAVPAGLAWLGIAGSLGSLERR
jgi:hypothetical protein